MPPQAKSIIASAITPESINPFMRLHEIITLDEAKPIGSSGGVAPLSPAKARSRARKIAANQEQTRDEHQRHAAKLRSLRRKTI